MAKLISTEPITTKSRTLKATWTVEKMQDLRWVGEPFTLSECIDKNGEKWFIVSTFYNTISSWIESHDQKLWYNSGQATVIHEKLATMLILKFGE